MGIWGCRGLGVLVYLEDAHQPMLRSSCTLASLHRDDGVLHHSEPDSSLGTLFSHNHRAIGTAAGCSTASWRRSRCLSRYIGLFKFLRYADPKKRAISPIWEPLKGLV